MKENMLYFDWYVDDRVYSLEYAGIEDDLAVLETDNYILYLTIVGPRFYVQSTHITL